MLVGVVVAGCGTSPEFIDDIEPATPEVIQVIPNRAVQQPDPVVDSDDDRLLRGLVGRWKGVGHQSDGSSWEMEVDVTRLDEGPCAIVQYPSLGCGGYWECLGSAGRRLRAIERITVGTDTCVDRVRVDLRLSKSQQEVAFTAKTGDVGAAGRLTRAEID